MQPNTPTSSTGNDYRRPNQGANQGTGPTKPGVDALIDKVGDALQEGKAGIQGSATEARDDMTSELSQLRRDMAKMQETVAKFATDASGHAAKTAQNVGNAVAGEMGAAAQQVVDAGAKMAASATEQAKTFASELEAMARRNPFGTLAGTLIVGVLLGMMSRGRA